MDGNPQLRNMVHGSNLIKYAALAHEKSFVAVFERLEDTDKHSDKLQSDADFIHSICTKAIWRIRTRNNNFDRPVRYWNEICSIVPAHSNADSLRRYLQSLDINTFSDLPNNFR